MRKIILLFSLLFLSQLLVKAQEDTTYQYPKSVQWVTDFAEWGIDLVTFEKEKYTFFVIPMVGYEKRTQIEFGVMPVWRFYLNAKNSGQKYFRPSFISPSILFSTTGMYEIDLSSGFYTANNWLIKSKWLLQYLPDKYYGIGNQDKNGDFADFDLRKYEFRGSFTKGIINTFFVGLNYDLGYFEISNVDGAILDESVPGYRGGGLYGIGPTVYYDSRNNTTYPSAGQYVKVIYDQYFSSYHFYSIKVDARSFYKVGANDKVIGVQAFINTASGDVPFFRMPTLGGKRAFRGIGRPYQYMDNNVAYLQAEYRSPLWWRIGYVLNAGIGNVYHKWNHDIVENVHVMAGGGLRLQMLPKEKLSFRIDMGVTNRGDTGVYFTLGEAF